MQRNNPPRWLSPDPISGQGHGNDAQVRKRELRVILRESREKLKKIALETNTAWGAQHTAELLQFQRMYGIFPFATQKPHSRPRNIAIYWPIGSELDLRPKAYLKSGPHQHNESGTLQTPQTNDIEIQWWIPVIQPQRELRWTPLVANVETWTRDARGLPLPPTTLKLQNFADGSMHPCLVVTPCLAVDTAGIRLGYGGGYYDKFISQYGSQCLLAACVPSQLFLESNIIPREPHDLPVDLVVTEDKVTIINSQGFKEKLKLFAQN